MRDGFARPEHSFETNELTSGGAMTKHLQPARIGGDRPTDCRTVTAGEVYPVGPTSRSCSRLDVRDRRPGTDGELAAQRIDVSDADQPAQAQHHLPRERDAAADEPGVSSLGNEGDPGFFAHGDDGRHLGAVSGTDDRARITSKSPGPVNTVGRRHFAVGNDVRRPNGRAKLLQEACGHAFILAPAPCACFLAQGAQGARATPVNPVARRISS